MAQTGTLTVLFHQDDTLSNELTVAKALCSLVQSISDFLFKNVIIRLNGKNVLSSEIGVTAIHVYFGAFDNFYFCDTIKNLQVC